MFCKQCGHRLGEGSKFCGLCGESAATGTSQTKDSYKVIPSIDGYMPQKKPSMLENIVLQILLFLVVIAVITIISTLVRSL